jgi:hypothetical protein
LMEIRDDKWAVIGSSLASPENQEARNG